MSTESKNSNSTTCSSPACGKAESGGSQTAAQNGKGDAPRSCFSDSYRSNYDTINWGRK